MLYKATVHTVLLYGSTTWSLTPVLLGLLEGFPVCAAMRMSGLVPRKVRDSWEYPELEEVLAAIGLHTIKHYIGV